ncbi:hypothetical protein [Desertihabitans brevis]|nr:hypothetical protein [Desertihabitans brevis]
MNRHDVTCALGCRDCDCPCHDQAPPERPRKPKPHPTTRKETR